MQSLFIDSFLSHEKSEISNKSEHPVLKPSAKVENGIWCLKVTVKKSLDAGVPVIFEYFVREGDFIQVKRFLHNEEVYNLKVLSVNWNEIVFDVL